MSRLTKWSAQQYASEEEMKMKEDGQNEGREDKTNEKEKRERMRFLEGEVARARDSEREMLESLVSQTKQLEKAKIDLEEAKLELRSLRQHEVETRKNIISMELLGWATRNKGGNAKRLGRSHSTMEQAQAQQEINDLKNELRLATEGEENRRTAMDDLALALTEVSKEANRAEEELAAARAEADRTMSMLKESDEALREAVTENARLKAEAEELSATWEAKEEGLRDCVRLMEKEISRAWTENEYLREMQRVSRGELSKLRDIMKHAVNEANVVKESLEIARVENSHLKDAAAEKGHLLQCLKQELDSLKVSEAAAIGSVEELKSLLAATSGSSHVHGKYPYSAEDNTVPVNVGRGGGRANGMIPSSSSARNPTLPAVEWPSPPMPLLEEQRQHRRSASVGSASMPRLPAAETERGDDHDPSFSFDIFRGDSHIDFDSFWGSPEVVPKKKPIFRKFGEMLRKSFRK